MRSYGSETRRHGNCTKVLKVIYLIRFTCRSVKTKKQRLTNEHYLGQWCDRSFSDSGYGKYMTIFKKLDKERKIVEKVNKILFHKRKASIRVVNGTYIECMSIKIYMWKCLILRRKMKSRMLS